MGIDLQLKNEPVYALFILFFFCLLSFFFFLFPLSSQLFILTHIHYGNDIFPALGEQDSASQVAEQKFSSLSFPWE